MVLKNATPEALFYVLNNLPVDKAEMDSKIIFNAKGVNSPEYGAENLLNYLKQCKSEGISPIKVELMYDSYRTKRFIPERKSTSEVVNYFDVFKQFEDDEEKLKEAYDLLRDTLTSGKGVQQVSVDISGLGKSFGFEDLKEQVIDDLMSKNYDIERAEVTLTTRWSEPHRGDDSPSDFLLYRSDASYQFMDVRNHNLSDDPSQKLVEWFDVVRRRFK